MRLSAIPCEAFARMTVIKFPISALPLPATSHVLTQSLTPDPAISTAKNFRDVLMKNPSVQRRSRLVDSATHFSHVTPLNLPFPYRIQPPKDEEVVDKASYVEHWLSSYEPLDEQPLAPAPNSGHLKKYSREKRDIPRELIGLSDSCLRDCLPHLAVGDAFVEIGPPSLSATEVEIPKRPVSGEQTAIRQELIDVLTGHSVLMSIGENIELPYAPWSLRYSGHQFGSWAGQLGDGRAISILETPHPTEEDITYELQLKGAGRTPYSRTADGLAVLRSSIREYLCAEAMHALHIPTTRSLALINLPELEVIREELETACVLTRVAPSFIRIGSFQALNPPENMFFLGGGQQAANLEALRILGEWVSRRVLKLGLEDDEPWGKALVLECTRRNIKMVAGWQAYGFMHGVINTDNVSILGLTIDYGPYAFMDIFNENHICNHSDSEGRYSYKFQQTMILYALRALLDALSPLIGAELESGKAVKAGWAKDVKEDKISEWTQKGTDSVKDELVDEAMRVMQVEYWGQLRKRLGLKLDDPEDADKLFRPFLNLLENHALDFHSTFRRLCFFRSSMLTSPETLDAFIFSLNENSFECKAQDAMVDWRKWLEIYSERIRREKDAGVWEGDDFDSKREQAMKKANPRFILRQWVLEEIIKRVQDDSTTGKRALAKLHEMATNPFEPWGAEGDERPEEELTEEVKEERRVCGLGAKRYIGFQCSCSS